MEEMFKRIIIFLTNRSTYKHKIKDMLSWIFEDQVRTRFFLYRKSVGFLFLCKCSQLYQNKKSGFMIICLLYIPNGIILSWDWTSHLIHIFFFYFLFLFCLFLERNFLCRSKVGNGQKLLFFLQKWTKSFITRIHPHTSY